MREISVLLSVNNAEEYIVESIESVLKQSFSDFELIIVNFCSIEAIKPATVSFFADERIRLIDYCNLDRFELLNLGIKASTGKYLVIMDTGSIMHVDMLKIYYSIMEEHLDITICGSWETVFGNRTPKRIIEKKVAGWVDMPLIQLLLDDSLVCSAYMVRKSLIDENHLQFRNCDYAEDYKFWVDTALLNGGFYLDSQPLVYKRFVDTDVSGARRLEKLQSISQIKSKIIPFLCNKHHEKYPALQNLYNACMELSTQKIISEEDIYLLFNSLFMVNKDIFNSPYNNQTI